MDPHNAYMYCVFASKIYNDILHAYVFFNFMLIYVEIKNDTTRLLKRCIFVRYANFVYEHYLTRVIVKKIMIQPDSTHNIQNSWNLLLIYPIF